MQTKKTEHPSAFEISVYALHYIADACLFLCKASLGMWNNIGKLHVKHDWTSQLPLSKEDNYT